MWKPDFLVVKLMFFVKAYFIQLAGKAFGFDKRMCPPGLVKLPT